MRVFVRTTGRSGSTTLSRALAHATNVTVGHESRNHRVSKRFDYPAHHIEIDNRLCWLLGPISEQFPDAQWVHLQRDPDLVSDTFARIWSERVQRRRVRAMIASPKRTWKRWTKWRGDPFSTESRLMILHFAYGVIRSRRPYRPEERKMVARMMVETMESNIRLFLAGRPHHTVRVESFTEDVSRLWDHLGLTGDKKAALSELAIRYNTSRR